MTPQPGVELDLITDKLAPGVRSCWGFMYAPIVRHRDTLYAVTLEEGKIEEGPGAVPWLTMKERFQMFRVFKKEGEGPWTEGFRGASQQTVCLLMPPDGALRGIGGIGPEVWTAAEAGRADRFALERLGNLGNHPYHGAGMSPDGYACASWCEQKTERVGFYDATTGKRL